MRGWTGEVVKGVLTHCRDGFSFHGFCCYLLGEQLFIKHIEHEMNLTFNILKFIPRHDISTKEMCLRKVSSGVALRNILTDVLFV